MKGAVPFVPVPTRLSPGEMRQAAILGLTAFPRTGVNGPGEFRFLLRHPTPGVRLLAPGPLVGTSPED